jgi:hypothetical protein
MISHPRYTFSKPLGQNVFSVDVDFLKDDILFIKKNKIDFIELNIVKNYFLTDIGFLEELPFIKYLQIISEKINDFTGLVKLKNLERLYLSDVPDKTIIDLTGKSELNYLNIPTHNISGLADCIELKELVLRHCNFEIVEYSLLPNLTSLWFIDSKKLNKLDFLPSHLKLEKLELAYLSNLLDISLLDRYSSTLKELKIDFCKKINDSAIETIEKLHELEKLVICDSIKLPSTLPISKLLKLKYFVLMGSSYFINGDISLLRKMKLNYISIDDKKHYNSALVGVRKSTDRRC